MRYNTHNNVPVHSLHYTWTGWPTDGSAFPPAPDFNTLATLWKTDGISIQHHEWRSDRVRCSCSIDPHVSPVFFAQRMKGRIDHALRKSGHKTGFSRKVSVRAIGNNLSDVVKTYIRNQLLHTELADPKYIASLLQAAHEDPVVDLSQPAETDSGRYWYNLHIVLVTADRYRMGERDVLRRLRKQAIASLHEEGCSVRSVAVMPDHIHVALRGNPTKSPVELGVKLQNATAAVMGCCLWQESFYAGSFSEYDLNAIR